jgi:TolB-like protein/tRNA A-37 threonylcarbamoyl transferase component Bud32
MPLSVGDKLGPYEIIAPIGAGGMGEVWKARDTRLNRIVAIKQLKGQHSARFEQEARAIATLNHPHICQIHDIGPDYLVMEYVDGKSLSGPLAVDEAIRLAIQIADALEDAHGKGILHRDLKPANILVTGKGATKLLDFGVAKLMSASDSSGTQTMEGTVLGTAAYMSPEQAQGKPLDERSDIFSFGAMLYELVSGRRPFAGNSTVEVLSAVLRDEPLPLTAPAAFADVVRRCLAKRAADRFASMAEAKAALDQITAKPSTERQPSIAVLPFANMSGDRENEYFSDGLAEEIINALAQVSGLKVTARTSAFAFRGKEQDIRKIADALNVQTVLEGSVRRAGNRIRVTAQLINAADGYHLWSQRYDREMEDVFAVQDDIAAAIASALQGKLVAAPDRYRPNPAAYEAYLKGRHYLFSFSLGGVERARGYFEEAIALDPKFAKAYSGLGSYFFARAAMGWTPAHETIPMIRTALTKALDLDPMLPEAQGMLGAVAALYEYDWTEAERHFRMAVAVEPVPVEVLYEYARCLTFSGRAGAALTQVRKALDQDPLNAVLRYWMGVILRALGRDDEGLIEVSRALEAMPHFAIYNEIAMAHASKGKFSEAMAAAERAVAIAPAEDKIAPAILAGLLKLTGGGADRERALLDRLDSRVYGTAIGFAVYHLICGEVDQAADWVVKSIEERYLGTLFFTNASPLSNSLRSSPRWPGLAKMMNLPESVS